MGRSQQLRSASLSDIGDRPVSPRRDDDVDPIGKAVSESQLRVDSIMNRLRLRRAIDRASRS